MGGDERMSWMEILREDARKENCRRVIIGAGHEKSMSDNVKPVMVGERDVSGYVAPDEANFVPPSPCPKFMCIVAHQSTVYVRDHLLSIASNAPCSSLTSKSRNCLPMTRPNSTS